jgi:hypothetical protein
MKISVEQDTVKVTIDVLQDDLTTFELLEHFKSLTLALTYQEGGWKDAICEMAELYRVGEEDYVDVSDEDAPETNWIRSQQC